MGAVRRRGPEADSAASTRPLSPAAFTLVFAIVHLWRQNLEHPAQGVVQVA